MTLDHKGEQSNLSASFVVGCDGAHSAVRHLLKLPFEGAEYEVVPVGGHRDQRHFPADELQLCPSEFGPVAIFPMSATRRRVVATVENTEGDAPSLDLVRKYWLNAHPKESRPAASTGAPISVSIIGRQHRCGGPDLHRRRRGSHPQSFWRARDEYRAA